MSKVYFKKAEQPKRGKGKLVVALLVLLALIGGGVWWYLRSPNAFINLVDSQTAAAQEQGSDPDATSDGAQTDAGTKTESGDDLADTPTSAEGLPPEKKPGEPNVAEQDAEQFSAEKMKEIQGDIVAQLEAMKQLQTALEDSIQKSKDADEQERLKHLAKLIKIVNSMRAEDAARVVDKLEDDLAVKILASLTGAKASKIMANMPADKAAKLSEMMVKLKPEKKLKAVMDNWQKMTEQKD